MTHRVVRRLSAAVSVATAATLLTAALPAQAARTPAATTITLTASPVTALVHTVVLLSGQVTPAVRGGTVELDSASAGTWHKLATLHPTATGAFSYHVTAPRLATVEAFRVVRPAGAAHRAGLSKTLHLHVVAKSFTVVAHAKKNLLGSHSQLVVTGKVTPSKPGAVYLQRLVGHTWTTVAKAAVKGGVFTATVTTTQGYQRFRVLRPASLTLAGSASRPFAVSVNSPQITTASLPSGVVGVPYTATLAAHLGTGEYRWSESNLPPGVYGLSAGALFGTPTAAGTTTLTVTVTDDNGFTGTKVLSIVIDPVKGLSWGNNGLGQLGNGATTVPQASSPTAMSLPGLTTAIVGGNYTLARQADGTVWAWGDGREGELGDGTVNSTPAPQVIPGLDSVTAVAAGFDSAYALKSDGTVWAWGDNSAGQLGDGTLVRELTPHQVPGLVNVVAIAAGDESAMALNGDGTVSTWGNDDNGQLGNNTVMPAQPTPVAALTVGGTPATKATAIAAGQHADYAVLADGSVSAWGLGAHGALGNGDPTIRRATSPAAVVNLSAVKAVTCSSETCFARHADGTVSSWGGNNDGQLGTGTVADNWSVATVPGLTGVVQVASENATAYALLPGGAVDAWGDNFYGQVGDGTLTNRSLPTAVPGLSGVVALGAGAQNGYAVLPG